MTNPLIEVNEVRKYFRPLKPLARLKRRNTPAREVLRGVSFSVPAGEWLALMGANGAGKTTLLKLLAGLLLPDGGRMEIDGVDIVRRSGSERGRAAYVLAEERSFHWRLTARQNLEFFSTLEGMRGAASRARIQMLLDRLDLLGAAETNFATFSTGMKQRLAVARALLVPPKVLLMDEPTRSLDAGHATEVWQLVREQLTARDGCVVLVTHQMDEALAQCDRIAILDEGEISLQTTADRLRPAASATESYEIAVRGLSTQALRELRQQAGIRDVRIASEGDGEQQLEVWTRSDILPVAGLIGAVTASGAMIASFRRADPLYGVIEQLNADRLEEVRS